MKNNETNGLIGLGKFFIVVGLVLLGIRLDILGLGEPHSYLRWEMIFLFFGIMALINLKLVFSLIMFAIGFYFLLPEMSIQIPEIVKTIFWPSMLVLAGLDFILRPIRCRRHH
jgi:hypothetical protein